MLRKTQKYNFKKLLPIAMIGLLPVAFNACEEPEEIKKIDKTLTFNIDDGTAIKEPYSEIKKLHKNKNIENIYLKPEGYWSGVPMGIIRGFLENTHAQSPKVKAAPGATFNGYNESLKVGELMTLQDSLGIVALGYSFQR